MLVLINLTLNPRNHGNLHFKFWNGKDNAGK